MIAEAETQRSILELAIAGDEVAFARIVAAHHEDMARIAYFVCGQPSLFEEQVADMMPVIQSFEFHPPTP